MFNLVCGAKIMCILAPFWVLYLVLFLYSGLVGEFCSEIANSFLSISLCCKGPWDLFSSLCFYAFGDNFILCHHYGWLHCCHLWFFLIKFIYGHHFYLSCSCLSFLEYLHPDYLFMLLDLFNLLNKNLILALQKNVPWRSWPLFNAILNVLLNRLREKHLGEFVIANIVSNALPNKT